MTEIIPDEKNWTFVLESTAPNAIMMCVRFPLHR